MRLGKLIITIFFSLIWVFLSVILSKNWFNDLSNVLNGFLALIIITGIAYLPGFIGMNLIMSLIMIKLKKIKPIIDYPITILIPVYNEGESIFQTITSIAEQDYIGKIKVIVINNNSSDQTVDEVLRAKDNSDLDLIILHEDTPGKDKALNKGLQFVTTNYFITLDGDTILHRSAVGIILSTMHQHEGVSAIAGGILVKNDQENLLTRMQKYDYLLSITGVKNMQALYHTTLVAQGAFSLYHTETIKEIGGWDPYVGEDIILTWKLLKRNKKVLFEPRAVSFTVVPKTIKSFVRQRSRWARGMIEGLRLIKPWQQGSIYAIYLTFIDLLIPFIDIAYVFFFVPGVILGFLNRFYIFGPFALYVLPMMIIFFYLMFEVQKQTVLKPLNLKVKIDIFGFILFILFYQFFMAVSALIGYFKEWLHLKKKW